MAKRKQNIFQKINEIDAQQQRSIVVNEDRQWRGLKAIKNKKRRLSPNKFLVYFYGLPIGGLIILSALEFVTYDRSAAWASLGHAIFTYFLSVFGLGIIGLIGMIYSIWYLSRMKNTQRRWQYYVAIILEGIFLFFVATQLGLI